MKIEYNLKGAERKALVAKITELLDAPAKYLGTPSMAYEVAGYLIDKTGTLMGQDNFDLVSNLREAGFEPASETYTNTETPAETPAEEPAEIEAEPELVAEPEPADEATTEPIVELDAEVTAKPVRTEREFQASTTLGGLTIEIPLQGFTPEKLYNLTSMVLAKEDLLKAALGVDALPIELTDDTVQFPWFTGDLDAEHANAYAHLISRLCATAIEKKRVVAKESELPENPKYAMRCFLLSLGMLGTEYKNARKILTSKLDGNSSWKFGRPDAVIASDEATTGTVGAAEEVSDELAN